MSQEKPVAVVWKFSAKAAPDAREFQFHPTQIMEPQLDASLIVRFRAGGLFEMAWHLLTWGDQVEIIKPIKLRKMLQPRKNALSLIPRDQRGARIGKLISCAEGAASLRTILQA